VSLSVVITIVEGGAALTRCLTALADQVDPPALEILVPWDDSLRGMETIAARFPRCTFLAMGRVQTGSEPSGPRGQHELFDRRRSRGLAAATGEIVAILEDRGIPTPDWAHTIVRLHQTLGHAVIGGAVENGIDRYWNWAVFFCDFTRYQRPFTAGPAQWVTDVNVSYKRRAIQATEPLWRDRYHEPIVHGALVTAGETLYLTPELVVHQMRTQNAPGALLRERLQWGRLFGYTRVRSEGPIRRFAYLATSPLIPAVLFVRQARLQWGKGHFGRFASVSPAVALLHCTWSLGEAIGYLTGRP
jgi:hypothetical protein